MSEADGRFFSAIVEHDGLIGNQKKPNQAQSAWLVDSEDYILAQWKYDVGFTPEQAEVKAHIRAHGAAAPIPEAKQKRMRKGKNKLIVDRKHYPDDMSDEEIEKLLLATGYASPPVKENATLKRLREEAIGKSHYEKEEEREARLHEAGVRL